MRTIPLALLLVLSVAIFAQRTSNSRRYDVVQSYHASGSNATTTGTITANTASLAVASAVTFAAHQGIFVAGCVATSSANPAGNLVTSISSIAGNTIMLAANCTVGVTGALVQHDETNAANNAFADCMNNVGGEVWFPSSGVDGIYKFSAVANVVTGGILTFPQNLTYQNPAHCSIVGEALGSITPGNLSLQTGGVSWDFSRAPNVAGTWALAPAAYVATTGANFTSVVNSLDVQISGINIWLPAHTAIGGLMFNNIMQAGVGTIYLTTKADSFGTFNQPAAGTTGIWMPGWLNNVQLSLGPTVVLGFDHCVVPGEHLYMDGPYLVNCNTALYLYNTQDLISGHLKIEQVPVMMQVDSGVTNSIPIDLVWDNETCLSTGGTCSQSWQVRGPDDLVDAGNRLLGRLAYKIALGPNSYVGINKSGGANLTYCDLGAPSVGNVCQP